MSAAKSGRGGFHVFIQNLIPRAFAGGLSLSSDSGNSQDHGVGLTVVPLSKMPPEQWVVKISGDLDKLGAPFVIRIHNDAGYVVLPHIHPMDENITVVQKLQ